MVVDRFAGNGAARIISLMSLILSIAPAAAPIIGGTLITRDELAGAVPDPRRSTARCCWRWSGGFPRPTRSATPGATRLRSIVGQLRDPADLARVYQPGGADLARGRRVLCLADAGAVCADGEARPVEPDLRLRHRVADGVVPARLAGDQPAAARRDDEPAGARRSADGADRRDRAGARASASSASASSRSSRRCACGCSASPSSCRG